MTEKSSADTSGVTIFPPAVYLGGLVIGYVLWWFWPVPIAGDGISLVVRILGIVVLLLGGWLMFSATGLFARIGTNISPFEPTTKLATDGPYRFTRNPIYLGMALILGGFALIGNALWPLLALIPVIWVIQTQVIAREEPYLAGKFGIAYHDYCRRVRRWL